MNEEGNKREHNENLDHDDNYMEYDYKTTPPWSIGILLGIQHFLSMSTVIGMVGLLVLDHLCLENNVSIKSELISSSFFLMGIGTLLQTICGCKLPIFLGASFLYVVPFITTLNMDDIRPCNISDNRFIQDYFRNSTMPESVFHMKIRLISGSLFIGALVETLISITGVSKYLRKIMSPLSLASIYTVLCMSISESLIIMMAEQWAIGITGMGITIVTSVVLAPKPVPIPTWWKGSGWKLKKIKIFQISPIIIALLVVWSLCGILTVTGAFPKDPNRLGYLARTDFKFRAISNTPIFKIPYIMPWGLPIMKSSIIVGVSVAIVVTAVKNVGDYLVTAQLSKAPEIPQFAINRGILMEGISVLLCGLFGVVASPTVYLANVGVMKITKAANLRIAQITAAIMMICGIFPVTGAVLVALPNAVVGGVGIIPTIMIMSCVTSNLQFVNLNSARNALVFGISLTMGIYLPQWSTRNMKSLATGYKDIDDIIQMVLSINIFISFVISTFLDSVLPGHYFVEKTVSPETTQYSSQKEVVKYTELERCAAYDPVFLKWIATKCPILQYLSLFPSYRKMKPKKPISIEHDETDNKKC